jgi:hypothetical protein
VTLTPIEETFTDPEYPVLSLLVLTVTPPETVVTFEKDNPDRTTVLVGFRMFDKSHPVATTPGLVVTIADPLTEVTFTAPIETD